MHKPRKKGRVSMRSARPGEFKRFKTDPSHSVSRILDLEGHKLISYEPRPKPGEKKKSGKGEKRFFDFEDANGQHTVVDLSDMGVRVSRSPDAKGQAAFIAHDGTRILLKRNETASVRFSQEELRQTRINDAHKVDIGTKRAVDERGRPMTEITFNQAHIHQGHVHAPKKSLQHRLVLYGSPTRGIPQQRIIDRAEAKAAKSRKPFDHSGIPMH